MKLLVLALAGCTTLEPFMDVQPVSEIPALAGRLDLDGVSCSAVCKTGREWKKISSCMIATLEVAPYLACKLHTKRDDGEEWTAGELFPLPPGLPASGEVAKEHCLAAGCKASSTEIAKTEVVGCSIYPYRPDPREKFLVCNYLEEREVSYVPR